MAKKNLKQANDKLVHVVHGHAGQKRHNQQAGYVASSLSHLIARSVIATATVTVAFTVALSAPVCSVQPASAQDASGRQIKDFKHRKRMIVAPSENVRRIDYQSLPGRDSLMLPNYVPKFPPAGAGGSSPRYTDPYASGLPPANMNQEGMLNDGGLSAEAGTLGSTSQSGTSATGRKPMTKTSRAGLTPPPPPIKSGLLPQSLTKELPAKSPTAAHTGATASATSSASAPALSQQKVAQIKAQAEALVKKGKASEAQTLLGGYVKTYPHEKALSTELSKISLHRAQGHAKAGNHEAATQQARLAITHGENSPEIIQAAHGTLNSSLQKIGVKANAPEDRFDLGTKLMGQARYDEAAIEYSAAAKLKPSVEAYLGAGGASMKGGHQLQAKKYFQEALELNPESQPALRELGIARYHLKDYAGASADLTRALVINSGDKEAAHTLLELWHHQVASRPTDANAHLGLARAYQVAGDLPAAQNEYKTVVKIHPQHPNLPAARQSFKLAYARQESRKAYELAQTLESQGSLLSAYQKASDAVHLFPSETLYQSYAAQLAAKLQASAQNPGANNFVAAGAGMSAMANSALNNSLLANSALAASPSAVDAQITQGMNGMASSQSVPSTPSQQSTLVPGSTPEAPPSLIPTAQAMGLAPAAAPVISSAPFAHENMYQPISTDRQVSSMSNFLVSLRNFTMQQQNQIQDAEDSSIWNQGTTRKKSILPGLGGAADLAADGALSGIAAPSGLPSSLPSGVQAAPPSSDVADVLKNAALALANTKSGSSLPLTAPSFSASAVTSTINSATTATSSTANSVATAASMAAAAPVAATTTIPANPYAALAIQAAQSAAQKAANRFTTKSAAAKPVAATSTSAQMAAPSQSWAPAPSPAPTAPPPQYNQMAEMNAPQSNSLTSSQFNNMPNGQYNNSQNGQFNGQFNSPPSGQFNGIDANSPLTSNATASQYAPPQMMAAQPVPQPLSQPLPQALQTGQAVQPMQTAQASGSVKLLLQGVKAAKDDVQLKVLLRNETAQEIKLPSNMKATVRSASQGERQGKASFTGKTVSPGASVTGTIKIQGSSLDPTADVVIPASSLAILGMGDLHLTVPISQR